MPTLSDRQQRMFEFISRFTREKGRPPTIREIGAQVGISSTSVVNYNLNILVREGYIAREKEISRGLRVVSPSSKDADGSGMIQIPLLGTIAAGRPIPVPEGGLMPYEGDSLTLTRGLVPEQGDLFALKVKGNSMIDALINDGDIVVMKKTESADNGDMVAVWLKDEKETTLKRIYREKKRIRLQPMNPTMKAFFAEPDNVEVQGKVVLVVRQLQRLPA